MANDFQALVIADSVNKATGKRITTLQLTYPRFIHSEFMTHRVFSRNAMSSRAVPVAKMLKQIREEPAAPIHWGKNEPGMSASTELEGAAKDDAYRLWMSAAWGAADIAQKLDALGAHKQIVNRILEPFQWMHTVVTSTEWDNFFLLRCHPDAQPEIQFLAHLMVEAMKKSGPREVAVYDWHIPYVSRAELDDLRSDIAVRCSVARCARVSYLNHDGSTPDVAKDLKLYERLVGAQPRHASPAEHQAMAIRATESSNNFQGGWKQYRDILETETSPQQRVA